MVNRWLRLERMFLRILSRPLRMIVVGCWGQIGWEFDRVLWWRSLDWTMWEMRDLRWRRQRRWWALWVEIPNMMMMNVEIRLRVKVKTIVNLAVEERLDGL